MIVYMDRASIESLTVKDIREIVVKQSYQMKYQKLERYYVGDHDILHSERTDKTGGDNRIVNNMARYITDTATGYFLGQPVVYSSENEEYLQTIQDIPNPLPVVDVLAEWHIIPVMLFPPGHF